MKASPFLTTLVICLLCVGSCSIQETDLLVEDNSTGEEMVFHARFKETETKSALQANESSIWWSRNDDICIYFGQSSGNHFVATNDEDEFSYAQFSGTLTAFTGQTVPGVPNYFWAVYPYDSANGFDGDSLRVTLPAHQTATAGSFANKTNISIAKSLGLDLFFYNTCSWFRFSVVKPGIVSVVFRGNSDEYIAGSFDITMEEDGKPSNPKVIDGEKEIVLNAPEGESLTVGQMYYITLLPGAFENGFTVTFYTGNEMGSRSVDRSTTFVMSKYNTGRDFDASVVYEPTISVIKYTTSDDQPVALDPEAFDYDVDSHVYVEGEGGTITFTGFISEIGDEAFKGCSNLQTITIPETVTTIGADAFRGTGLKGIEIPASVEEVGIGAFADCPELADITVSEANEYLDSRGGCNAIIETKGNVLIAGCKSTTVPDGIVEIAEQAFYGCEGLENITLPDSVNILGEYAFYGCEGLTFAMLSQAIGEIAEYTFYGCTGLERVALPGGLTEIGDYAFTGCASLEFISTDLWQYNLPGLTTFFYLSDSVTSIGEHAFEGCSSLVDLSFPDTLTSIGEYAFSGCTGVNSLWLSASLETVSRYAFSGCSNLKYLTIQESITSIEEHAFDGCSSLQSPLLLGRHKVVTIGAYAFRNCTSLTGTFIPNTVTSIGNNAFEGCTSLYSISISNSVTAIADSTFYNYSNLSNIVLPSGLINIGNYAFYGCSNIKSFVIPDSMTSISKYAFAGCSSLSSVTLPSNLKTIGEGSFKGCSSLSSISFPSTLKTISNYSFQECTSLSSITIPATVISIGNRSFFGCTNLASAQFYPTTPPSKGQEVFDNCKKGFKIIVSYTLYNVYMNSPWHISQGGYTISTR